MKEEKSKLIVICGISGSGKSTVAKQIAQNFNMKILSSDAIREELGNINSQDNNQTVFEILRNRLKDYFNKDIKVIIDATNLSIKSRRQYLEMAKKYNYETIAYIVNTPFEQCKQRNLNRDRIVPEYVLEKQIRQFQIPFYEEGWDEIRFDCEYTDKAISVDYLNKLLIEAETFDQKNKYHNQLLLDHMDSVAKHLEYCGCSTNIIGAGEYHDVGKLKTQTIDEETGQAHYYGHENYGAYILSTIFNDDAISKDDFLEFLFYVNYHMIIKDDFSEKTKNKYKKLFGEEKYKNLELFHLCDKRRE